MSKKIFQALMLLTVFSWYESARADCTQACEDGFQACDEYCSDHEKTSEATAICLIACHKGEEACLSSPGKAQNKDKK